MKTRVKIELTGEPKARYAYATDEHAASSHGQPVIEMGGDVYGCADPAAAGGTVVTADRELAEQLQRAGYRVRVSDPQAQWAAKNMVAIGTKLTRDKSDHAKDRADALGLAMSGYIQQLIQADLDGRVDWADE